VGCVGEIFDVARAYYRRRLYSIRNWSLNMGPVRHFLQGEGPTLVPQQLEPQRADLCYNVCSRKAWATAADLTTFCWYYNSSKDNDLVRAVMALACYCVGFNSYSFAMQWPLISGAAYGACH
jgi:hypothetical protein